MTTKKVLALSVAIMLFIGCCVQAVREDIMQPRVDYSAVSVDLSYLILEDISVPDTDAVIISDCSLANETAVIAQVVRGSELTDEQFQQCGQAVVYVETRYLGLCEVPTFILAENGDSYYDPADNSVHLSKDGIDDWYEFVESIIHITYHAYEKEQMQMYRSIDDQYKNLLVFEDAQYWSEEEGKYSVCGKKSEELWVEKDAIKYADSNLVEYAQAICEYWHYSEEYLNLGVPAENKNPGYLLL